MTKTVRLILILAASFAALGLLVCGIALALGARFHGNLTDVTKPTVGTFSSIEITSSDANIHIRKSATGETYAVSRETDKVYFTLTVENDTLLLREVDTRAWYDQIGIFFGARRVTLYLASESYDALAAEVESGGILVENTGISFGDVTLSTTSGGIRFAGEARESLDIVAHSGGIAVSGASPTTMTLSAISGGIAIADCAPRILSAEAHSGGIAITRCRPDSLTVETVSGGMAISDSAPGTLSAKATSGGIAITDTTVGGAFYAETNSGGVRLRSFDASEITIDVTSGGVDATLKSGKIYEVRTESGGSSFPQSDPTGGLCKVTTRSGSVRIRVE